LLPTGWQSNDHGHCQYHRIRPSTTRLQWLAIKCKRDLSLISTETSCWRQKHFTELSAETSIGGERNDERRRRFCNSIRPTGFSSSFAEHLNITLL